MKEEDEKQVMELMCRHFEFYGQMHSQNIEYALRGAKLSCTHGNKYIQLDMARDHGIYDGEDALMVCGDCILHENIYDFGACGNGKFEPVYSKDAPPPGRKTLNKNGQERHVCLPVLLGEWGCGSIDSRSLLISVGPEGEGKVYADISSDDNEFSEETIQQIAQVEAQNRLDDKGYSRALMTCDNLLCLYGGVITIEENPPVSKRAQSSIRKRFSANKGTGDQNSDLDYEFKYDWMKEILGIETYVTEEALKKVVKISADLEINPDDLMAVMAFESWLDPHKQIGDDGPCGLIQFTQTAIDEINRVNGTAYTKDSIKQMDIVEQLDVVYLHLEPNAGKMKNLEDVYVGVFASKKVGKEVLYSINDKNDNYEKNKGLDENKDGTITRSEAAKKVIERRDTYFRYDD